MSIKKMIKIDAERITTISFCFLALIGIVGSNAFANFSLDRTFTKHSYLNLEYNPNAKPVYVEVCESTREQGESCGEKLLNATDYQETIPYRKFIFHDVAVVVFGHNEWNDDDMLSVFLTYWAITAALTWFSAKRMLVELSPKPLTTD